MKTYLECLTEAATAKDWLIGAVLDNWDDKQAQEIMEKAADIYAHQSNLHKPDVVRSLPDFKFTEWLGETYIRLNQVWVHRYSSQLHKENWKTTEELYELYLKQQGQ